MRLILFVPQLCSGGAQQVAVLLSSAMADIGHEVFVATASLEGELVSRLNPACHAVDFQVKKPIQARRQLAELVNRLEPDAVICFGIYTGIAAALSRTAWKRRPVFIIRNENNLSTDWQQGSLLNRLIGPPLSRWAARDAHVVAVSHALRLPTARFLRASLEQVTAILNPVLDDRGPPIGKLGLHPWLVSAANPVFVAMGRLEYQKGFDVLIAAFAKVRAQTKARLLIFGQGSLAGRLQGQIDAADLGESVQLAGHTDNPFGQMRAAHAFVLSSRFEGFGLVIVEALWAGTHVISTDCDYGPAELLEDGRYGRLVPVDDVDALADAMHKSVLEPRSDQRPTSAWFGQFTAAESARQHLELIRRLRGGELSDIR